MSVQNKKIYRVRNLSGHDIAVLLEVREDDGAFLGNQLAETRSGKIALGGVDSFWAVSGEKSTARFSDRGQDSPLSLFSKPTASVVSRIKSSSDLEPHSELLSLGGQGKLKTVTFSTASRLKVGFSPSGISHAELVDLLRQGKLAIQSKSRVDFIEVQPDVWMIAGFTLKTDGFYALSAGGHVRSVQTARLEGKEDSLRLGSGLVVFKATPRWSSEISVDLRPEPEVLQAVARWLARADTAATRTKENERLEELFDRRIATTVDTDEKEDLSAALRILDTRQELSDTLLRMMENSAGWKQKLASFERSEEERLREEMKARFDLEAETENHRLLELRGQIADAEARLESAAHRAFLLRNETEQHDARLKEKIIEAARAVGEGSSEAVQQLRDDIGLIRRDLSKFEQGVVPAPAVVHPTAPVASPEVVDPPRPRPVFEFMAIEADRTAISRELAVSTGLTVAEIASIVVHSTKDLPVVVGDNAMRAVTDIVSVLGGPDAAIVFCDPTKVTLADLLADELGGLSGAVVAARARPDVLVPVALCNLTSGPCEFWLPQLLEMRRHGRLPRNLALIASAATDGMRVSVPSSLLRGFFPIMTGDPVDPGSRVEHVGGWPFSDTIDVTRVQEAVRFLMRAEKKIDGKLLGPISEMLSRAQSSPDLDLAAIREVLVRQQEWLDALRDGSDNEFLRFFQRIEG